MVGPTLNQHVAWAHEGLVLVQDGPDLALEADRVVDGVGRVESVVPRRTLERDLAAAPLKLFRGVRAPRIGREVDDANHAAASVSGRYPGDHSVRNGIVRSLVRRRRGFRRP